MRIIEYGSLVLFSLSAFAQQPLSLQEAVRQAIDQHPSMESSTAGVDAAETRIKQAESGYLPRFDWQESYARSNNPVFVFSSLLTQRQFTARNFAIGELNRPDFLNNFQSVLSVDQTVYDAGQTKNRKHSAKIGKQLADEQVRATRMNVIANVARAYHGAVLATEVLKVAEEAVRSAEADLKRAEAVRDAGMATDADVLSIKVHLAAMQEQRIARDYDLRVARSALNEALGQPLDTEHSLTTTLTAVGALETAVNEHEQQAVAERPELRQADLSTQMAVAQGKLARAAYWPQISVRGAFEADRQEFIRKGGANWFFGATMRWNLFNGFETKQRVAEAAHHLRAAEAEKKRADAGVRLQVRKAHADFRAAGERIEVAAAAVTAAEESLRITKNRYEAGLTTMTDLLRNETALMQVKTRKLAAIYDQRVAAANLELASGVLSADSRILN